MERSLYPSELAAPTMKPMEPHVASRTKYWAKLLTLPSHKKKLELCRFWWLYSIFGFCYAFLFLLFSAFVSFVFPQIWLWGLRFENLDWPPARRSCCFPFLFSQSFFKSPMQKHGRKLWFLDPQRSLQILPNTFSNFISIISTRNQYQSHLRAPRLDSAGRRGACPGFHSPPVLWEDNSS